ncbi:hypothetical protein PoB_000149300, partial [Plakobranchus ocellatus]
SGSLGSKNGFHDSMILPKHPANKDERGVLQAKAKKPPALFSRTNGPPTLQEEQAAPLE